MKTLTLSRVPDWVCPSCLTASSSGRAALQYRRSVLANSYRRTFASSASRKKNAIPRDGKLPDYPARTRFAPSPTGYMHIGGLRTALFSYLLAKRTGGQFILRIEDTDQVRKCKERSRNIQSLTVCLRKDSFREPPNDFVRISNGPACSGMKALESGDLMVRTGSQNVTSCIKNMHKICSTKVSLIVVSAPHKLPELVRLLLLHLAAIRTARTSPSPRLQNEQSQVLKSSLCA